MQIGHCGVNRDLLVLSTTGRSDGVAKLCIDLDGSAQPPTALLISTIHYLHHIQQ